MFIYFIKCVARWSENSVRFVKSFGNWLPDGPYSVRFSHSVRYGTFETTTGVSNASTEIL